MQAVFIHSKRLTRGRNVLHPIGGLLFKEWPWWELISVARRVTCALLAKAAWRPSIMTTAIGEHREFSGFPGEEFLTCVLYRTVVAYGSDRRLMGVSAKNQVRVIVFLPKNYNSENRK